MVQSIREVEAAMGSSRKSPTRSEQEIMRVARKSLVAADDIAAGELFTPDNLSCKRPGTGVSPLQYWRMLGKRATRNYAKDELIKA